MNFVDLFVKTLDYWGVEECNRPVQEKIAKELMTNLRCDRCKHYDNGECKAAEIGQNPNDQYYAWLIVKPDHFCKAFEGKNG